MGASVCSGVKVHYVNVDNGELDHLGDLSDLTDGLLGFSGPLLMISDYSWDKKDLNGEQNARWNLRAVLSSDEISNYNAYMEYSINDGILQTPGNKSWNAPGGMREIISKAFAEAKEASALEFSKIGYDVIAMKKFQYDMVGVDRDTQPTSGGTGYMLNDRVLAVLDTDEAIKQAVIDSYSVRVITAREKKAPMSELMWEAQPWMLKSNSYMLDGIDPGAYPLVNQSTNDMSPS